GRQPHPGAVRQGQRLAGGIRAVDGGHLHRRMAAGAGGGRHQARAEDRVKVPYVIDVVERRWLTVYVPLFALLLYLPSLLILLFSFNDGVYVAFPLKGFTTSWYEKLAANDALLRAARNSFVVGLFAATIATIAGTLGAFAIVRYKLRIA